MIEEIEEDLPKDGIIGKSINGTSQFIDKEKKFITKYGRTYEEQMRRIWYRMVAIKWILNAVSFGAPFTAYCLAALGYNIYANIFWNKWWANGNLFLMWNTWYLFW